MTKTMTYEGVLSEGDWGDQYDALLCGDVNLPSTVSDDMENYGRYLTVRYAIADRPTTIDDALHHVVSMLDGLEQDGLAPDGIEGMWGPDHAVHYFNAYSEITGYLWTEESLVIGGHDLLKEFREHIGQYLVLEVSYSSEPKC